MRAEKLHLKKSRLPPTPHNLSIHKDVSGVEQCQATTGSAIPVLKDGEGEEVLMGDVSLLLSLMTSTYWS